MTKVLGKAGKKAAIAPPSPLAQLALLGEEHSGRDEMNLAGHPFALLQAPGRRHSVNEIYYEWPRALPGGKSVMASWRVGTDAAFGLPGPGDELLYLVLLQMTREAARIGLAPGEGEEGVWPQVVPFSRGLLLRQLGWNDGAPGCQALEDSFSRLNAVNITANHAFWDARARAPMSRVGFHILSNFGIMPEPRGRKATDALPLSWFKWDDVIYASILSGNVRSLALDFTLSLESPTARRLFRLLDLLRCAEKPARREFSIGLWKLRDRLGMTPYQHASKIKEKLAGGIKELEATGFLARARFEKTRDGLELAVFSFGNLNPSGVQPGAAPSKPLLLGNSYKIPALEAAPEESSPDTESALQWAQRLSGVYALLPEEERLPLRDLAREGVEPIFWDRLESPDSPMSLGLWELVEERHG